jgi:hypothetical protein
VDAATAPAITTAKNDLGSGTLKSVLMSRRKRRLPDEPADLMQMTAFVHRRRGELLSQALADGEKA